MKLLTQAIFVSLIFLVACTQHAQEQTLDDINIQIDVIPNPPTIGEATLLIKLTDAEGAPIDDAMISVIGNMGHEGMMPVESESDVSIDGEWQIPFTWTMTGDWFIDVNAELTDNRDTAQAHFEFSVAGASANHTTEPTSSDISREFHITIPKGTNALIESGQDPNVIPSEVTLKLDDYNILVIQNNDIADHFVGPFFIKAGESIRQEFTRPAIYEGGCSIHKDDIVRIVVEE
jgi:hypothetical protein